MRKVLTSLVAAIAMAGLPVQAQQAGTLVAATPVVPPRGVLAGPVQAWKIAYWTRDAKGARRQVTGMVIAPANRMGGPRPVIAWAHGTWGVAQKCAPSASADFYTVTPALSEMIARGYTVVAPDFPGLGSAGAHPYLVGIDTGRSVLDAVRAAGAVPGASAGKRFAVWGESQGGHAALWTGQLARSYAPGFELVGIAAAAPPTDLAANLRGSTNKSVRALLTAFTAYSWGRHYGVPLTSLGNRQTQGIVTRLAQNNCVNIDGKPRLGTVLGIAVVQQRLAKVDLGMLPPWSTFARSNSVMPRFAAPLFIAQSEADPLVAPDVTRAFAKAACRNGTRLRYLALPGGSHATSAKDSATATLDWIDARFAGTPAPSDCKSI